MKKKTIITVLLALVALAGLGQTKVVGHVINERGDSVDSTTVKQDSSMAIGTDSLCCSRSVCNCDTVQQDSCLQQHRLSFINKGQKMTQDINPNALKLRKFDPYKKKFTDMRIIETIGSHISR